VKYDKYSFQVVERVGLEERGIWEVDMLLQWATGGTFECVEEFKSSHEDYFISEKVRYLHLWGRNNRGAEYGRNSSRIRLFG
jgi:hypothetical protein